MTGSVAPAEEAVANGGVEGGAAGSAGANGAAGAIDAANGHAKADAGEDVEAAAVAEKPEFGAPQDMSYLQARRVVLREPSRACRPGAGLTHIVRCRAVTHRCSSCSCATAASPWAVRCGVLPSRVRRPFSRRALFRSLTRAARRGAAQ